MKFSETIFTKRLLSLSLLFVAVFLITSHFSATGAMAAQATLSWVAPTTYTDGTALTSLAGYKVMVGTSPGNYSQNVSIGNTTSYTFGGLNNGTTYYFAVSAFDTAGTVSAPSSEVSFTTPSTSTPLYTITASAGTGGSISPAGGVVVSSGMNQSFAITPATGYKVAGVTVDGAAVGAVTSYTFSNVTANHTISATFASSSTGTTTPGVTFAINNGGPAYTDSRGISYEGDTGFTAGAIGTTTATISGTTDQALYRTERYGNCSYTRTVPNGDYNVTLKFAEIYYSSPGQRVFSIAINGKTVVSNLDLVAKVGRYKAYDVVVPVTVTNGSMTFQLINQVDKAKVNAIVVTPATAPAPTTPPAPATGTTFAINNGGPAYTDSTGIAYEGDTGFAAGAIGTTTATISGTTDQALYRTERYGNCSYTRTVPNGDYNVTLKFAEIYYSSPGQRVFSIAINGKTVVSNLDLVAKVGRYKAYDVVVPVTVTNGSMTFQLINQVDKAKVNAIVVTPATATAPAPTTPTVPAPTTPPTSPAANTVVFAANAGGAAYSDASGLTYQADSRFSGGAIGVTTAAITGTSDPKLYQTERYGTSSYNVPVTNGTYVVTLKFAEIYYAAPGRRVFNVAINGATVVSNLDIYARAGKNAAYDLTFPVTVTNGAINIQLINGIDKAKVSAIKIVKTS